MKISPRELRIEDAGHEVCWEESQELLDGLAVLREQQFTLPATATGGYVLVALNVDGEDWDGVLSQACVGEGSHHFDLLSEARAAIDVALRGFSVAAGVQA